MCKLTALGVVERLAPRHRHVILFLLAPTVPIFAKMTRVSHLLLKVSEGDDDLPRQVQDKHNMFTGKLQAGELLVCFAPDTVASICQRQG